MLTARVTSAGREEIHRDVLPRLHARIVARGDPWIFTDKFIEDAAREFEAHPDWSSTPAEIPSIYTRTGRPELVTVARSAFEFEEET